MLAKLLCGIIDGLSKEQLKELIDKQHKEIQDDRNKVEPLTEELRDKIKWGTYGINGDQPLKYVVLRGMDHDHIDAILRTQTHISLKLRNYFIQELFIRARNGQY